MDRRPASRGQSAEDLKLVAPATTGTVKWFDDYRGFGILDPDGGGDGVFVHITTCQRAGLTLREGDRIRFDIVEDRKSHRPHAENLRLASVDAPRKTVAAVTVPPVAATVVNPAAGHFQRGQG